MFNSPISNKKEHEKGIITFTIENTWMPQHPLITHGWGNGYIGVPEGHPLFGRDYEELNDTTTIHYGFTFGEIGEIDGKEYHVFGFDTCHYGDTMNKWPELAVVQEIESVVNDFIHFVK